jgi:hypothetical protein
MANYVARSHESSDSMKDELEDASVAGVTLSADTMSDAELTQPAPSPKDSVVVDPVDLSTVPLDRLSIADSMVMRTHCGAKGTVQGALTQKLTR